MRNELSVVSKVGSPLQPGLRAFLDVLEYPAAVCDRELVVLDCNPAFELLLVDGARAQGRKLTELFSGVAGAPSEGNTAEAEVRTKRGQALRLSFSHREGVVAVLAKGTQTGDFAVVAGRALLEQARVEQALLELGRNVVGATSEDELVAAVSKGVKGLFPGRAFCVRIADPRSCELTSMYAVGQLNDLPRDVIVLRRSATQKTNLPISSLSAAKVRVTDEVVPLMFRGTVASICAPLVSSSQLFGVINIEYPEGMSAELEADERVLIQLANQVAVGVRNVKLIEELTVVRKYLEELLEHANALIVVVNRDRKVTLFNRELEELTGLRKADVLGKDVLSIVPSAEQPRVSRVFAAGLQGEREGDFETRLVGVGGREVRVAFATSAVPSPSGDVDGVIAIGKDLTRMRELEHRVIQAEKLASLGQLAASVVHEINNPMTAVVAYADAMLKRQVGQATADAGDLEKLKRILENCDRVLRFTRDLVSYARPTPAQPEEVDLNAAIERAMGFCDHLFQKHSVTVRKEFGELPKISAVKGNLIQVFVNLLTNACHAMGTAGGTITVVTRRDDLRTVVEVRDNGSGIDPSIIGRIFEPFFTTKPDGKGTGLGLSIVQGIVESCGGVIRVESAAGVGTTFHLQFPLHR